MFYVTYYLTCHFFLPTVDDGTGVIHCCYFHPDPPPSTPPSPASPDLTRLPLGTRLHVRGGLQEYRDKKQVVAYSLRVVTDPNEESARVFRVDALYRSVYEPEPRR